MKKQVTAKILPFRHPDYDKSLARILFKRDDGNIYEPPSYLNEAILELLNEIVEETSEPQKKH